MGCYVREGTAMKVTVCDFPDEMDRKESAWSELVAYLTETPSDVVVLPEMPFCYWVFDGNRVDPSQWSAAVHAHQDMIARMAELPAKMVLSSRPIDRHGRRLNEAFVWSENKGYQAVRAKWYLPDAPDGRETVWFEQGDRHFTPISLEGMSVGFQLCSEMIYVEHAREIGLEGAHLIAQPRATGGHARWRTAAAMSAVTSGCFVASANRRSYDRDWFSGGSWIISPNMDCLAETTDCLPFATAVIDLKQAECAKEEYPCDMHRTYAKAKA